MNNKDNRKFNPQVADQRRLIGEFIRERRIELKWSQEYLAERADIRKGTLIDVEMGRGYNINTLIAILGILRGELKIDFLTETTI